MVGVHELIKNGSKISYSLPFESVDSLLNSLEDECGEKKALLFINTETQNKISLTYKDLNIYTKNLGSFFLKSLKKKSSISFSFSNTPEIIVLNYAIWRAGMTSVPLDTRRDTLERKIYKLRLTNTKILFTRDDNKTKLENKKIKKAIPTIKIIELKNLKQLLSLSKKSSITNFPPHKKDSTSLVLFTSGTTAKPKGVELTLTNLFSNAESIIDWLKITKQDKFLVVLPLHHINSTTFTNATILSKGTIVLCSQYSKSQYWKIAAQENITIASIVPTIAYDLLHEQKAYNKHKKYLLHFSRIQIGSAPVQPLVVEKIINNFNISVYQGYGQTETALRSTGVPMGLKKKDYLNTVSLNTLGTELRYTSVTVLKENSDETKSEEIGEICIRGPIIMKGYLKNKEETKKAFEYSWFHSGDTGFWKTIAGKKMFFIKGRTKEIIKKAGTLISPLAIENALLSQYEDLKKVYAVGYPDERLGQKIGIVALSSNPKIVETIINDAKNGAIKNLTKYESPESGIIIKESDLPKTSTGKIQRVKIKEKYSKELQEKSLLVATTDTHSFRKILPHEKKTLHEAVRINNIMWGKKLHTTFENFQERAKNATILGVFDKKNKLLGTISCLQATQDDIKKIGTKKFWANTWDGITSNGTFANNTYKGNALVCPAISIISSNNKKSKKTYPSKQLLTEKLLEEYSASDNDYVLRFHRLPKAGLKKGAEILKIIPNGRPEDTDSLGYNILFKYPNIKSKPILNTNSSIGIQLIEAALLYAYNNKIHYVYAYSRPAELSKYFTVK